MGTHYEGTEDEIRALNAYIKLTRASASVVRGPADPNACLAGLGVWLALDTRLIIALVFGALISATDPVAVVSLFKELGARPRGAPPRHQNRESSPAVGPKGSPMGAAAARER